MLPAQRVTQGIAWATIAAFVLLFVSGSGAREAYAYMAGLVPARISGTITVPGGFPIILTPITATLLHGSDRHSVVLGKSVAVRVDFGGSRHFKKKHA